jgi:hypothetical protein
MVLDARKCAVDSHHASALRESVLLPVLTLVQASTDPEGPVQQRLDQAILRYRSNRDNFLAAVSASRGTP